MRKNRNRPESDEPLSEGRVEYLEAARQRAVSYTHLTLPTTERE